MSVSSMFVCQLARCLYVSQFDVCNSVSSMFVCQSVRCLYVSKFDVSIFLSSMFVNCTSVTSMCVRPCHILKVNRFKFMRSKIFLSIRVAVLKC